jgi:hypothetical protein
MPENADLTGLGCHGGDETTTSDDRRHEAERPDDQGE